jgi:hypothetical protein
VVSLNPTEDQKILLGKSEIAEKEVKTAINPKRLVLTA